MSNEPLWVCSHHGSTTRVTAATRAVALRRGAAMLGAPEGDVVANPAPEPIAGAPVPEYPTREELGW